jgi:hypothetical protein
MSTGVLKDTQNARMPWTDPAPVAKTVVVDSRQRNCERYKSPAAYTIDLDNVFKNVISIELKGAILPKSNYNIHSGNNKIDFAIGDFVTSFEILDRGAGYTVAPTVTLSSPPGAGVTATATAIIDAFGSISNIIINVAGSGYTPSKPPFVMISPPNNPKQARQPRVVAVVGNHYTASLRLGEYDIGGNPVPPLTLPNNLLLEIQNAMNYAVNGGAYNPISTSPFAVRVVSQYPILGATAGTPEAYDTNACLFNRIQTVNVNSDIWEFLWCTGPNKIISAASVMGFNTVDSGVGTLIPAVVAPGGTLIPAGTAIRGPFDYNLKNDPDYVIMTMQFNHHKMDRVKSQDDGLNETFAALLFDNNNPETLHDLSAAAPAGSIVSIGGVQYLQGPTGKGVFWRDAGAVKPIKGYDFDTKKMVFTPPIATISNFTVQFTKFGYKPGGVPLFYNMEGREHVLLFEFICTGQKPQQQLAPPFQVVNPGYVS